MGHVRKIIKALALVLLLGVCFAAGGLTETFTGWVRYLPALPQGPGGDLPPVPDKPVAFALQDTVVALGRLEPEGGVINLGAPMGDRLERLLVNEGDEVHTGQELASLESHSDRVADRNLTVSQLHEAKARRETVQASCQALIEEAKIHLEQARIIAPLNVKAQEAKVNFLQAQLDSAQRDLTRLHSLQTGSVPKQKIELQDLAVRQAAEELASAQALLEKIKASCDLDRRAAEAQLQTARANLVRYRSEIPLDSLEKARALAEARLSHTILRAPGDGQALKILAHPGETAGSRPVLQMGNTKDMRVIAEVYETAIQHVRVNDRATATSPALPEPLAGTVIEVGSMIAKNNLLDVDPTAAADRRVAEVTIRLDRSDLAANFVNMQVKVTITPQGQPAK